MKTNIIGSVINTNVIGDIKNRESPEIPPEEETEQQISNDKVSDGSETVTEKEEELKINRSYWNL